MKTGAVEEVSEHIKVSVQSSLDYDSLVLAHDRPASDYG